jgi:hypothetical protein
MCGDLLRTGHQLINFKVRASAMTDLDEGVIVEGCVDGLEGHILSPSQYLAESPNTIEKSGAVSRSGYGSSRTS